jgi:hypothetical protein
MVAGAVMLGALVVMPVLLGLLLGMLAMLAMRGVVGLLVVVRGQLGEALKQLLLGFGK